MVAGAPVRALRVTYVGELGWELHVPVENLATVYDALMAAGSRMASSMLLSRHREPTPGKVLSRLVQRHYADHSPLEAGMGWAVKLKKNTPFLGREALQAQSAKELPKLLACSLWTIRPSFCSPRDISP